MKYIFIFMLMSSSVFAHPLSMVETSVAQPPHEYIPDPTMTPMPTDRAAAIAFVGDVNFTGRIGEYMNVSHTTWPFQEVKDILSKADYRVCNLENPAGFGGAKYCDKSVYFKANPKNLDALTYAGFDMVTLANNHALDYGPEVLSQTVRELEKRNIKYMGISWNNRTPYQPTYATINGLRVAFLGFCNACP